MKDLESKTRTPRDFHGDPLAYYLANHQKYKDCKNRTQLFRADSGMHRALIRYGQIDLAFPDTDPKHVEYGRKAGSIGGQRTRLSEEEIGQILSDYEKF